MHEGGVITGFYGIWRFEKQSRRVKPYCVMYTKIILSDIVRNSYITGARDVWHLLHRSPRALCPRVEGNKCHTSRVRVI